ncbi:Retrovirus-related Pol polyprotein from transposon TNT 1-94 [Dendrobium catenatum]|uniref:Retrovirus-related Pol polyprotein from transposon TNT 1-94 n=1 Tax=Dendrobium catenatum TaxID=906689 RepID=A0A2I0W468_9ASPA|nr:Retrovirus-related Pol polyprotein from transposon TNT 1-94 [Dendrobium catenatum]
MTQDLSNLSTASSYNGLESVSVANGNTVPIQHTGNGLLPLPETARKLRLQNILHVPSISHNLVSISKLTTDNNISIVFYANGFVIKDSQDNRQLLRGHKCNGLYQISSSSTSVHPALHIRNSNTRLWHSRLGHPNSQIVSSLSNFIPDLRNFLKSADICISCKLSKCHKLPFTSSISISTKPFQLIHADVWGPSPCQSINGFSYYVIFIDDFTRYSWLYLMTAKSKTFSKFKIFCNLIHNKFNTTIQYFRSDGGGEFISNQFTNYLQDHGITRQLSSPHTPEQNDMAERKHRHLLDITRTLLHAVSLPQKFWAESLIKAHYLINRIPSKATHPHSPHYLLHGQHPSYLHLRTFGCLCFPWLKPYTSSKLASRSRECVFLGYSTMHKAYRCLDIQSNKVYISRHVTFQEDIFPFKTTNQNTMLSPPSSNQSSLLLTLASTIPSVISKICSRIVQDDLDRPGTISCNFAPECVQFCSR